MFTHRSISWLRIGIAIALFYSFFLPVSIQAANDSTVVTFVRAPVDIMNRTATGTFSFPTSNLEYRKILMIYSIECSVKGCDPWDRVSTIAVRRPSPTPGSTEEEVIEIGRLITPPGRGGSWVLDVTDYRAILRDSVTLSNYVKTSIGGGQGFQITVVFRFIGGNADVEAYKVENLWNGLPVYGDPDNPIERFLRPIGMKTDEEADFVRLNIVATGHGEGNTDGAARYSRKLHELSVADTTFSRYLWRDDCADLPGTPDIEEWKRPHAGFCLGEVVAPWQLDISRYAMPGSLYTVDYSVEPYVNECRPGNIPCPCENCKYEMLGHTQPFYWIESQAISYRIIDEAGEDQLGIEATNKPGVMLITPRLASPSPVEIQVRTLDDEEIYRRLASDITERTFRVDLSTTPGVYLLRIVTPDNVLRRRLVVR